jgi:hypothetical protein
MSKIQQPDHYQGNGMNANEVIRAFDLNFALGNAVKYVLRAGRKPDESAVDDLRKAIWYLNDELNTRSKSDLNGLATRESGGQYGRVAVPRQTFINALRDADD